MNKKKLFFSNVLLVFVVSVFLAFSCAGDTEKKEVEDVAEKVVPADTLKKAEETKEPILKISYKLDSLETAAEVDTFQSTFEKEEKELISALNRVDVGRINKGDVLVIPDTLTGDIMDYSPFPEEMAIFSSIPKTVLISRRIQAFALYEKEKLIKWGPVSSGKESTQTPAGLHYGNYKAKNKVSTVNKDWLMPYYFNFMNFEGVGTHQYSMPGYPASHACVRLRKDDAVYIYNWAEQWELNENGQKVLKNGTPFMVLGDYDFDKPVPWLALATDPEANELTSEEMKMLQKYVSEYMKDDRNFEKDEQNISEGDELAPPPDQLETIR